jgi:phosphatidylserine decarboxylase
MKNYETVPILYRDGVVVNFLYNKLAGRMFLSLLVRPLVSKFAGVILDSPPTKLLIRGFVKRNNIIMEEYLNVKYKSFNDFFIREIKKELRPFADDPLDLAAPSDGKLTAYPITPDCIFRIKNSTYTIEGLLQDSELAAEFAGGICLIFRLSPDDYHRYAYIDDGESISRKKIKGVLHTVRAVSQERYKVFVQNAREYEVMQTSRFGKVIQMEVGALFVGRISNREMNRTFKRGDEKGMFEFGGSTVVMLFQNNKITLDEAIYANTQNDRETFVRMGCKIGEMSGSEKEGRQ